MIAPEKPTVEEASVRYQALTKLTELSLDIASARDLNDVADKVLLATKIRLWLKGLQYGNYLTREQRYQIVYALIDLSGIYEFPIAPVLSVAPRPNTYINGVENISPVPAGGTTGEVLSKRSATDYDIGWDPVAFPASVGSVVGNTGTASAATSSSSISIVGTGSISTSAAGTTVTISGPAGGSIGGSNTQIQYNNAGAFAGDSALTFNATTKTTNLNTVTFSDAPVAAIGERVFAWDPQDGTLNLGLKGGVVVAHLGQTLFARVVNGTGGNLLKSQYRVVKVTGAQGQRLQVNLAQADTDPNSADTLGIVAENINNNQEGFIITSGLLTNINTTGSLQGETWADGDILFLSPYTPGYITKVKPIGPNHTVILGFVVHSHPTQGKIFVKIDNGYELQELHDCRFLSYSNNDIIYRDTSTNVWKNASIATILGYTPANAANVISSINSLTSATQSFAVGASGTDFGIVSSGSTHIFNIPSAGSSTRGLVTTGTQDFAGNKNFTGKVSIGSDLNASAAFEVNSTTKGILAPRMTQVERDAIVSPATGLLVFNTTAGKFNYYTGSAWSEIGGGGAAGTNDLNKSDGSGGFVQSFVFSTSSGNLTLGSGITGSTRTISADGSSSNVALILQPKGASSGILRSSDALKSVSTSNNNVTISSLTSTSGVSAQSQQRTDRLYVGKSTNNNNTVEFPLFVNNESGSSTNLPQVGIGSGLEFSSNYVNSLGGVVNGTSGQISLVSTSVTNTLTADLVIGISSASVINERLRLLSTGQLKLNAYTSTSSFPGTAAGYLAFDSSGNIITATGGGGGGTPGGSTTQVQFNDGGSFNGDAGFTYDKTTDTATIGSLSLTTIANATTDTDKFIVSDSGLIKYRTGTEILSDIGAIASSYLDTDTTLAANSDTKIATQKATKAYVDNSIATANAAAKLYLFNAY